MESVKVGCAYQSIFPPSEECFVLGIASSIGYDRYHSDEDLYPFCTAYGGGKPTLDIKQCDNDNLVFAGMTIDESVVIYYDRCCIFWESALQFSRCYRPKTEEAIASAASDLANGGTDRSQ